VKIHAVGNGRNDTIGGVRGDGSAATALQRAIDTARGVRTDDEILWSQPRSHPLLRNSARLVLGIGSTVAVGLLLALAVVGSEDRGGLLVALVVVVVVGGGLVGYVWRTDVGIDIRADGHLIRAGWGGIEDHDLRSYDDVMVTSS
jgi:hypothetical protein